MWIVLGIVGVLVLIGLFALISPGSPGTSYRRQQDGTPGWRDGANVSWFGDNSRDSHDRPR